MVTKKVSTKVKKPKLPPVKSEYVAGISTASFTTLLEGGKIKKLTEFITKRDKNDPYNPRANKYYQKVIYYLRVEKPATKTGKKTFKYVRIPEDDYDKYDLENESTTLTLAKYTFKLNNALTRYSKNVKVTERFY